jgi:hypothetical protein
VLKVINQSLKTSKQTARNPFEFLLVTRALTGVDITGGRCPPYRKFSLQSLLKKEGDDL